MLDRVVHQCFINLSYCTNMFRFSYKRYFTVLRDKVWKKHYFEQVYLRNQPSQIQKQKLTGISWLPGLKLGLTAVIAALNTVWNGGNNPWHDPQKRFNEKIFWKLTTRSLVLSMTQSMKWNCSLSTNKETVSQMSEHLRQRVVCTFI